MAAVAQHRGVQRLVHVLLGSGDVVVELSGDRAPHAVGDAQGGITVSYLVDDHAQGVQVIDVAEFLALGRILLDLVVYRVDALGPAVHVRAQAIVGQLRLEPVGHVGHVGLALGSPGRQHAGNLAVFAFVQMAESQVVQLPLELPDAQAMGQRRVDVQGFLGDAPPLVFGERVQRAHVVQPVREFDEHHADVLGHGHQHLAQAFGVQIFRGRSAVGFRAGRAVVHARQLGNAVHQPGHVRAEAGLQFGYFDAAVLQHIVEQGCDDGVGVQVKTGKDGGGGQRVDDVRVAGLAHLPVVAPFGEVVGRPDAFQLARIVHVFRDASDQIGGLAGDRDHRRPPDWHGVPARQLATRGGTSLCSLLDDDNHPAGVCPDREGRAGRIFETPARGQSAVDKQSARFYIACATDVGPPSRFCGSGQHFRE